MKSDPAKAQAWRERSVRRYQDKQRAKSRKRIAREGAKAKRERPAIDAFRQALKLRAHGFCEVQTPACPTWRHEGCDPHHLCHADRDRGVHEPERGLWVCRAGHDWIETHPELAYEAGWLLRDDGYRQRRTA